MRISIEGNIASGKSTQVKRFDGILEPINTWPLDEFYQDPKRWAFPLQLSILKSFSTMSTGLTERSPLSSQGVFWMINKTKTNFENDLYNWYHAKLGWEPDHILYINTPPEVCFERLKSRGQTGDHAVTLEYLKSIDNAYTRLLNGRTVHYFDGTDSPDTITELIKRVLETLK